MSSNNRLAKSFNAGGALAPFTIVKAGSNDYDVVQAAAATDKLLGVTTEVAATTGERADVVLVGTADVKLGGTVARGDAITSDASGNGITTVTIGNRIIGFALISGVAGDIVPVLLDLGIV